MSTRATYQFTGNEFTPTVTFYMHHDGYPEGAADYFHLALEHMEADGREALAEAFVRANDRARFTTGHDAHSDTEYQYTVTERYEKREDGFGSRVVYDIEAVGSADWSDLQEAHRGTLKEFVKKYRQVAA